MVDSAPSRPNLFVPLYLVSKNFSKYSAETNLSNIVLLPLGVSCISFFSSILSLSHLYSSADCMCLYSIASVPEYIDCNFSKTSLTVAFSKPK